MEQATGSADRPRRFSALLATRLEHIPNHGWEPLSVTEWELSDEIPDAVHTQDFGFCDED